MSEITSLLNDTNSEVRFSISKCGDLYQRRPRYTDRGEYCEWSECPRKEATDYFERVPGFEYRALAVMADVGTRYASTVVETPKPKTVTDEHDGKIVAWADRYMKRACKRDENGCFYATTISKALGITKSEARKRLEALALSGRLRTVDYANGTAWRSIDLLPYEVHL